MFEEALIVKFCNLQTSAFLYACSRDPDSCYYAGLQDRHTNLGLNFEL